MCEKFPAFLLRYAAAEWREFLRLKMLAFPPLGLIARALPPPGAVSLLYYAAAAAAAAMTCIRFLVGAGIGIGPPPPRNHTFPHSGPTMCQGRVGYFACVTQEPQCSTQWHSYGRTTV